VQDRGRFGHRASGVPISGAMDRVALDTVNRALGNASDAASLEWALGGGVIRFARATRFALGGATVEAALDDRPIRPTTPYEATAGAVLRIGRFTTGRFLYIGIAGGVDVPVVLGSRSTYLPARFGGHHGRLIKSGDTLPIGVASREPAEAARALDATPDAPFGVMRGPDASRFPARGWATFVSEPFRVSLTSDRTGYRLDGPVIARINDGSATDENPSSPVCPGVVQVPPTGQPVVLMADAPTIGGYPVLGVVSSTDLSRLSQCNPGDTVRFNDLALASPANS
jgi:biotin-dependent carboxylase-like uncharacterized protein